MKSVSAGMNEALVAGKELTLTRNMTEPDDGGYVFTPNDRSPVGSSSFIDAVQDGLRIAYKIAVEITDTDRKLFGKIDCLVQNYGGVRFTRKNGQTVLLLNQFFAAPIEIPGASVEETLEKAS